MQMIYGTKQMEIITTLVLWTFTTLLQICCKPKEMQKTNFITENKTIAHKIDKKYIYFVS